MDFFAFFVSVVFIVLVLVAATGAMAVSIQRHRWSNDDGDRATFSDDALDASGGA